MLRSPENLNHFLVGNTVPDLVRLFWRERREVDNWRKASVHMLTSAVLSPFRVVERIRTDRLVRETRIEHPPVLIVGHFRSGTTLLHNLLAQDPALGYVPTIASLLPNMALTGGRLGALLLSRLGPETRPMDEMPVDPWLPQEDEIGIGNMLPFGGFTAMYFPRKAEELFGRYVLFDDATPAEISAWKAAAGTLLKKATIMHGGRRIVLKNPWNTARIPHVLEAFPDAKFIHIRRNPYQVFVSGLHLVRTLGRLLSFQRFTDHEAEDYLVQAYRRLMTRYLETEHLIPSGNLVEVSFEELTTEPDKTVHRIYTDLDLPGYEDARPHFAVYLAGLRGYRQNRYRYTSDVIGRARREWGFAIDRWGYAPPVVD